LGHIADNKELVTLELRHETDSNYSLSLVMLTAADLRRAAIILQHAIWMF